MKTSIFKILSQHFFSLGSTITYFLKPANDWQFIITKFKNKKQELYDHDLSTLSIQFEDEQILVSKQIEFDLDRSLGFNKHVVVAKISNYENSIKVVVSSERDTGYLACWIFKIVTFLITVGLLLHAIYGLFHPNRNAFVVDIIGIVVFNFICMIVNLEPSFHIDPMYNYVEDIIMNDDSIN